MSFFVTSSNIMKAPTILAPGVIRVGRGALCEPGSALTPGSTGKDWRNTGRLKCDPVTFFFGLDHGSVSQESSLTQVLQLKGNLVFALGHKKLICQMGIEDVILNVGDLKVSVFRIEPLNTDGKPMPL